MTTEIRHNSESSRYELLIDGTIKGIAEYRPRGDTLVFHHTEIDPPLRGQGLGAQLVQSALEDVRKSGQRVVPTCWFVREFIDEHPEFRDVAA